MHLPMSAARTRVCLATAALSAVASLALLAGGPVARAGGPRIALDPLGPDANPYTFTSPVYVTQPPGRGGILVVEQNGVIRAIADGQLLARPFLNIRSLVTQGGGEQGLLSVAFPPDYAQSRRFYVYFNNRNCANGSDNCNIEIDEFKRAPGKVNHANASSRRRVLTIGHHANSNHNGGQAQFGPGGLLFLGTGDGGSGFDPPNNALNKHRLLGKLLRIDPRPLVKNGVYHPYRIPGGNPYVGVAGRDEIFSIGMRNPWRFSIDRPPGQAPRLAAGDVGQNMFEEVDYERVSDANGADFGWSRYEGNDDLDNGRSAPPPLKFPILTYSHSGNCGTIIGGYVIRQSNLPGMNGRYLYEDLCTSTASPGEIRSLVPSLGSASDDRSEGVGVSTPSSFGVDRSHRYYVASLADGSVYRLVPN